MSRRKREMCAICWVDPDSGERGTNLTTRICRACRADPANVDWVESPEDLPRPRSHGGGIDVAIRDAVRDVVREVVREEIRIALREWTPQATLKTEIGDGFLSIAEAAKLAHVHEATIRAWIGKGVLRGFRAGRHHRLKRADLERFMASSVDGETVDLDAQAAKLAAA